MEPLWRLGPAGEVGALGHRVSRRLVASAVRDLRAADGSGWTCIAENSQGSIQRGAPGSIRPETCLNMPVGPHDCQCWPTQLPTSARATAYLGSRDCPRRPAPPRVRPGGAKTARSVRHPASPHCIQARLPPSLASLAPRAHRLRAPRSHPLPPRPHAQGRERRRPMFARIGGGTAPATGTREGGASETRRSHGWRESRLEAVRRDTKSSRAGRPHVSPSPARWGGPTFATGRAGARSPVSPAVGRAEVGSGAGRRQRPWPDPGRLPGPGAWPRNLH